MASSIPDALLLTVALDVPGVVSSIQLPVVTMVIPPAALTLQLVCQVVIVGFALLLLPESSSFPLALEAVAIVLGRHTRRRLEGVSAGEASFHSHADNSLRADFPFDNIIAAQDQRAIIGQNLPTYIASLPPQVKQGARYLSKFVVGAGFGLFDYSLNAIWNEVVLDLHKKATAH